MIVQKNPRWVHQRELFIAPSSIIISIVLWKQCKLNNEQFLTTINQLIHRFVMICEL